MQTPAPQESTLAPEVVFYHDMWWDALRPVIGRQWGEAHPILDRRLFDWQYRGFGPFAGNRLSRLLVHGGQVVGFRGVIPGMYQVPDSSGVRVVPGAANAMWVVAPEYQGGGHGSRMVRAVERDVPVIVSIGVNHFTASPIYRHKGYTEVPAYARWVLPLEAEGYQRLLEPAHDGVAVRTWALNVAAALDAATQSAPHAIDADTLAGLWDAITAHSPRFGLHRNAEFWNWRYHQSEGYAYDFFGDPTGPGVIIARMEQVLVDPKAPPRPLAVLRLIELLPRRPGSWHGGLDAEFSDLLAAVLSWGRTRGCVAADYQAANRRIEQILLAGGFRAQTSDYGPPECSLAGMFRPLRSRPRPLNAFWRVVDAGGSVQNIGANDVYLTKSDSDMDRPAI
jgi:GNAT superfamily N-acetyltransferase